MSRLRVAPIVEGHGEEASIRTLLQRIWYELLAGEYIEVLPPIRRSRSKLQQQPELEAALQMALNNLHEPSAYDDPNLVLILIDADDDCPRELGPALRARAEKSFPEVDIACVLANVEYETWFVAAAETLKTYLDLPPDFRPIEAPEEARHKSKWIEDRFRRPGRPTKGTQYRKSVHQVRLTAAMDLALCRSRSPSFNKLCRELESRRHRFTPQSD